MRRPLALAAALALSLAACGGKHVSLTGQVRYGNSAEDDYQAGVDLMKDGSWEDSRKFFEHVKTKYPFSKFAALSDLRLADIKFDQKLWTEAIAAYEEFARLHPTHEDVDYAQYRIGVAHLEDGPSDFLLFPPSYEKDQRQVEQAAESLRGFLQKYPESKYAPDAKKLLAQANSRLADHEWYVAEFYYKRDKWAGAAGRYQALVDKYPGSPYEPEALYKLAESCMKIDEKYRARTALQKLIVTHPQDKRRADAEKLLAKLR